VVACSILAGISVCLPALHLASASPTDGAEVGTDDAQRGPGYVCLLDDDVSLHPFSLSQLVDTMEHDASLFMATGVLCRVPDQISLTSPLTVKSVLFSS
jgi:GT2 family glycosyltransferase